MSLIQLNRIRSGFWIWGIVGENVWNRDLLYLSGDETWMHSDASAAATMPARGVAMRNANAGETIGVLLIGTIYGANWSWTPGAALYASATVAGAFTEVAPAAPNIRQRVGEAYHHNLVYFDPDSTNENAAGGAGGFGGDPDFFPVPDPDSYIGNHAAMGLTDAQDITVRMEFLLPTDFVLGTWQVDALIVPGGTGNMRRGVATDFGAICAGEQYDANSDTIAAGEVAVTSGEIECIDLLDSLTGAVAEDLVGIEFTRYGSHGNDTVNADCYFIGVVIRRP